MISLNNVIVFDIETVPQFNSFDEAPEHYQEMWLKRVQKGNKSLTIEDARANYRETSFYPEYAKAVCISLAYIKDNEWRVGSFCSEDEASILRNFVKTINSFQELYKKVFWAGHNAKRFDIPFVCRRCQVHRVQLPISAPKFSTKPWEMQAYDSSDFWKYGDGPPATLDEICWCLGIESPKTGEIDGSKVFEAFKLGNFKAISEYCERDVIATVRVLERLSDNEPLSFYGR